jgi:hypothetical protein
MYSAVCFPFRCTEPQDVSQMPNSTLHTSFHVHLFSATQVEIILISYSPGLNVFCISRLGWVEWINLAQDKDEWRDFVNTAMNFRVL